MDQTASGAKLKKREKAGFALSMASIEMLGNFTGMYMLAFYTNVAGISPAAAGTLMLLCTLWNAINDPLIGIFVDKRRCKNGDKLRPYLKMGIPFSICFIILFWMPALNPVMAFIYALVFYYIGDLFATFVQMPAFGLPALMTNDKAERVSISTWTAALSIVGPIIGTLLAVSVMRFFGGSDETGAVLNLRSGFRGAIIFFMTIVGVCQLLAYFSVKERVKPMEEGAIANTSVWKILKLLFLEKNWTFNLLYGFLHAAQLTVMTMAIVYYCQFILGRPGFEMFISPALLLASIAVVPFIGPFSKRFSKKGLMIAASICFIIAKIPFIIFPTQLWAVFANAIITGLGVTFSLVGFTANFAETADIVEWKHGVRLEGSIGALRGFISKGLMAIIPFTFGIAMQISGYVAPTEEVLSPVQNAATQGVFISYLGWVPLVLALAMLGLAYIIPTDKDGEEMRKSKAEKAAAVAQL
ncbi:MAG: MFS transporter [Clostridiales bacterium]|jgi:GPH family glycoside/pentoside/hexuronide:cation symporter|nr:MFS transporter [Clostridiales bacterium]